MKAYTHKQQECLPTEKPKFKTAGQIFSSKPSVAAIELIDGAYDIIEAWKPEGPFNKEWKKRWMEKARELGANPSW